MFSAERAQKLAEHNLQNKERRASALIALESEDVQKRLVSQISEGGQSGRRLAREIQRFESTGRINNWLSNEILKTSTTISLTNKESSEKIISYGSQTIESPKPIVPAGPTNRNQILTNGTGEGGGTRPRMPWDIYVDKFENNVYTIKVWMGTVSNIIPSNWETFQNVGIAVPADTIVYGIAALQTDGQFITSATIIFKTTPPEQQTPTIYAVPTYAEIAFGAFVNGISYNVTGGRDLSVQSRNVLVKPFIPIPQAGSPLFELYYRLQQ